MEKFDWQKAWYGPKGIEFLKEHQDKPLTEDEFVKLYPSSHPTKPNKKRRTYRHLKERFGFFVVK